MFTINKLIGILVDLTGRGDRRATMEVGEPPLRAELFGLEQFKAHGEALAMAHEIDPSPGPERLLQRLAENERIIRNAYHIVAEAIRQGHPIAPAAEWLLDNYYLISEQIDLARAHLPKGYSRELPRLKTGPLKGFPRVDALALDLVSHTDGRVDAGNLTHFVRAYQRGRSLTLGELWAIPIMLRLALLENLRRVAYRIAWRRRHRDMALEWAGRFVGVVRRDPSLFVTELADFVRTRPPLSQPFIAELSANIEGVHAAIGLAINWIEQELSQQGQTIEMIQQAESQDQAADQVSIGNTITSLRRLSAIDWRDFVEALSVTEAALRRDPAGVYGQMDFRTRDRYRHVIEDLAKKSATAEEAVAEAALRLATARRAAATADTRECHIGYFLVDSGLCELQQAVGCRLGTLERVRQVMSHRPLAVYLSSIAALTVLLAGPLICNALPLLARHWAGAVAAVLALLLVASRSALSLVNWAATLLVRPRNLPRLDFSKGVPAPHQTAVVVPTLIYSAESTARLLEQLEICYLGNRNSNLLFGVLADFPDAAQESLPQDRPVLDAAVQGIRRLNAKYAAADAPIFFLLYRPREWNPVERVWMGRERKRGKLDAFNRLVLDGARGLFTVTEGSLERLRSVKYVITLDADTQLPPESAARLAGALAHPLNRPVTDPRTGCVRRGYGVLQPRLGVSLVSSRRSWFARLFSGEVGIDPYTREVSHVYHDVLGQGQFVGKGIYDVAAFHAAVGNRFPPNRILSHDLIEGCHARCGFCNDVEFIEDHPLSHLVDARRHQRWIRGDWQIARWVLPTVPGPDARHGPNPLGAQARWMIFDNLRRSLVPAALLATFLLGWLGLPQVALRWTATVLLIYFLPSLARSARAILVKGKRLAWASHLRRSLSIEARGWTIEGLELALLPFQTCVALDAVLRALWRLCISGRRLLEWQTAAESARAQSGTLPATVRIMAVAPAFAAGVGAILWLHGAVDWRLAGPVLALWFASPLVVWFTGRPQAGRVSSLTAAQTLFLRTLARRTWAYFSHFMGAEHHGLPPDNFQEEPAPRVAARTSPTNIGMGLVGALAAYDFGYISAGRLLQRTDLTLAAMDGLERYRGHFYNWYSTQTLEPLPPRYVSTVDSGNLAGHLIVLEEGLLELTAAPILPRQWQRGLEDTARVLLGEMDRLTATRPEAAAALNLAAARQTVLDQVAAVCGAAPSLLAACRSIEDFAAALTRLAPTLAGEEPLKFWVDAMLEDCNDLVGELRHFAPWLADETLTAALDVAGKTGSAPPSLLADADRGSSLAELAGLARRLASCVDDATDANATTPQPPGIEAMKHHLLAASERATERIEAIQDLAGRCEEFRDMDFAFLYDSRRKLLALGYNLDTHRCDDGCYDLLASEARLGSFVAVAGGSLPLEHWFHLGRQLAPGDGQTLVSWSGSLFEYLMPLLVMPNFDNTLLDRACKGAVRRHIRYGWERGVPWGFSESCYNQVDAQMTYQYRAFGVPGLGLKRGLADDLVVAPYASVMALMVAPRAACANLLTLATRGLIGRFGLYEAVDYTPSRLHNQERFAIVKAYMAHHSGMSLLALDYALNAQPMQRRFLADPQVQSTALLLQERIPVAGPRAKPVKQAAESPDHRAVKVGETTTRTFKTADTPVPAVHLLSNGRYHVMLTNAGGGYSRWQDLALTRWREDVSRDHWGMFVYLADVKSGDVWSTTWQPVCAALDRYHVTYSQGIAEFHAVRDQIDAHTRVAVSPEDDVELRRLRITNLSRNTRTLELTSYAEVVLLEPRAESAHPVYQGLFVQTELQPRKSAILCTRRPRAAGETWPWLLHAVFVRGQAGDHPPSFETDRAAFIGRGRTPAMPKALTAIGPLSNRAGHVLDPALAVRRRIRLKPGDWVTVDAVMGVGRTRENAVALIDRYSDHRLADRLFDVAWTHSQVLLHQLRLGEAEAQTFATLASAILYADFRLRASASLIARNRKGQSGLWSYGISGDLPIVLLRMGDLTNLDLARQVIQAHAYWRHKGLRVDLVVWAEAFAGYRQSLLDAIIGLVHGGAEGKILDQPGGIFVRNIDQVPEEDQVLIQAAARVILSDRFGNLTAQLDRKVRLESDAEDFAAVLKPDDIPPEEFEIPKRNLSFFNGLGGFTQDGREYVVLLYPDKHTPAPWVNVLANPRFGSVVTESGGAYTWYTNAHEFRLTPWYNDPVCDSNGEAFYIRDEETGRFWSPTPAPARGPTPYVCRHGLGYTAFEHTQDRLFTETFIYVGVEAPAKFVSIKLRNLSDRKRRFSVTGFCEWVLGESREHCAPHVVTRLDPQTGAILAWNAFNFDYPGRVAFLHCSEADRSLTGNRTEFLGRNGSLAAPAAMTRKQLSNRVGAGFDPCAAIQASIEVPAGQQRELVFVLGAADNEPEARRILRAFSGVDGAKRELENVWQFWKHQLGGVFVETPDAALNFITGYWLLYQVLTARFWGRSGYYQSGGAYGFRDQLQDSLAFLYACPWLTRQHLLTAAGRQFTEGDVQHWWHPPHGRGVRTRISDDYLWLPYVTCRYVTTTGDTGVLDEQVAFLDARPLGPGEESFYDHPQVSDRRATLYEHCLRAIRHGLQYGVHGLPLMQGGDWNDGMNRVGHKGKGESVWLGFFLYDVLAAFGELAARRNDDAVAQECSKNAGELRQRIEAAAWDGQWYKRAFFDDGTPLGAAENAECRIDSIAQSWAVLSGAAPTDRADQALRAAFEQLVDRDHRLIKLLTPPFDTAPWDPGYIKGYVPGVRENGGQYTHAAIWMAMAWARMGKPDEAWECFNLLNPIRHGDTAKNIAAYKVEPYVVAADLYAAPGHEGRGGWTWYTGSAAWMYQLIVEKLLGLKLEADRLTVAPLLPADWTEYKIHYRYRRTFYHIHVVRTAAETPGLHRLVVDNANQADRQVRLVDDARDHFVRAEVGAHADTPHNPV